MPIILDPISSDAISDFTTKESARRFGGPFNADDFFNKENDGDAAKIDAAWLQAGQRTDGDIRNAWRLRLTNAQKDYAALETLMTSYDDEAQWLAETADWGIIIRGYEGRGSQDADTLQPTDKGLDGKMQGLRKRYEARLTMIASGAAPLIQSETAAGISRGTRIPVLPRPERFGVDPRIPVIVYPWSW